MPEAYPRSNPWPYVFSGLFLFGVMLFPPRTWPELMADASVAWVRDAKPVKDPLNCETKYQAPNSRVIVGYDPNEFTSITHKQSLDLSMPTTEIPNTSAAVARKVTSALGTPTVSVEWTETGLPAQASSKNVRFVEYASSSRISNVWTPPRGWQPKLIEPLDSVPPISANQTNQIAESPTVADEVAKIEAATRKLPKPLKQTRNDLGFAPVAGPVANHSSSSSPTRISPRVPDFQLTPSAADAVSSSTNEQRIRSNDSDGLPSDQAVPVEGPDNLSNSQWGTCERLYALLDSGARSTALQGWSKQLRSRLSQIRTHDISGSKKEHQALAGLRALANYPVDPNRWNPETRSTYWRIRHAVSRQTDVWLSLSSLARDEADYAEGISNGLATYARKLDSYLSENANTEKWASYLELDQFAEIEPSNPQVGIQSERTLGLLHNSNLDETQRAFLSQPAFRSFEQHLREAIAAHTTVKEVINVLDSYENNSHTANARAVIAKLQRFSASTDGRRQSDSLQTIDAYYRNANVRVSVSEQLINRFVPAFHQYAEQVNDTILGAAVRGRNSTMTNLSVDLVPEPKAIRLKLFADGLVDSNTASRKGPVVLYNKGKSRFSAGKELLIRPDGIFYNQTETRAMTGNRVVGMRTDLDGFPFIGALVRSIARQQADEQRPFMRAEILRRVRNSASRKMDVEVQRRLADVEQRVQSRVVDPLHRMNLAPRSMEMRTTDNRAILRGRLAGPMQLGAHSPRPQAVASNQMSIQVHQTAANNVLHRLKLSGRRMTLGELAAEVSSQIGTAIQVPEGREDVEVKFADHHAAEFEFENGQIKFTIHFAELDNGNDRWKNFSVCAYYRADVNELEVQLVRDGGIELLTKPLGLRDQIALRSIFTKVLSANPRLDLLRKAIQQQPSLRNLEITQFTIRDGWICVSLGESQVTSAVMASKASEKRQ